jgi:pentatricopeptide repeat protein
MFQRSRRLWQSAARNSSSNVNNNNSSNVVKKNYRGSRYRQPNHQKTYQPEFKKGDVVPPPKSLEEARRDLLEWAADPQRWSNVKKKNAMSLLFQVYDSHPFAVDPTPILERWQKESSGASTTHQETEAADVYKKFRLHGNPVVASIVLTTRLQFIHTAKEVVEAAQEFLTRQPDNILLYGNVLQRLAVLGSNNNGDQTAGDHMRQFVNTMVQNGVPINVVCFNIMLRYFSSTSNTEVIFEMIRLMKSCNVLPDHESYTQLVHAYLHAHQPEAAMKALLHIDQATNLAEAAIEILKYYRKIVTKNTSSFAQKREAVNAAKTVFERVGSRLSPKSKGTCVSCYCCVVVVIVVSPLSGFSDFLDITTNRLLCFVFLTMIPILISFWWCIRPATGCVDGHVRAHWRHARGQGSVQDN